MRKPPLEITLGKKIRTLRNNRHVTLDQLASQVKLTRGQLSRIENGKVSSPISTLTRIASALGVEVGALFETGNEKERVVLVKKAQRRSIVGRGSKLGHYYESLAFGLPFSKGFEPYLMTIEAKKIKPEENDFIHPGHEFLFMLEGEMVYRHGDKHFELSPGDSLFFDGSISHGPVSVFQPPVRFLSVISKSQD
ncbi:MAG: XRE family transcriptional regulator [Chthoniobacterales bacterium]